MPKLTFNGEVAFSAEGEAGEGGFFTVVDQDLPDLHFNTDEVIPGLGTVVAVTVEWEDEAT